MKSKIFSGEHKVREIHGDLIMTIAVTYHNDGDELAVSINGNRGNPIKRIGLLGLTLPAAIENIAHSLENNLPPGIGMNLIRSGLELNDNEEEE